MRIASIILSALFTLSCVPEAPDVVKLAPAYDDLLYKTDAKLVFANRVQGKTMQMVFARGDTDADFYQPLRVPSDHPILYAMKIGDGCVTTRTIRVAQDFYNNYAARKNITHIILCPTEGGFVGAGFEGTPPLQALPEVKELAELTDGYL